MTPVTLEQATFIAGFLSTSPVASNAIYSLTSQIQSITKERDEYRIAAHGWIAENAPGGWIDNLRKERDALAAAAKLAVTALDDWYYGANQDRPKAAVYAALQALKEAGVQ